MAPIIKDLIKIGPWVWTLFCKWEVINQICVLERLFGWNDEDGITGAFHSPLWSQGDQSQGYERCLRESFPRQVDRESRGPQRERGLEFQGGRKDKLFFLSLYSLGFYNNNVSCLRTVSGLNLLANSVILKCKLWEVFTTSRHSLEYVTSLLMLASGYSFYPLLMPMSEAFSISFIL